MSDKNADEIFCYSCGEKIKKEAEYCPNCGVPNKEKPSTDSDEHSGKNNNKDKKTNYETTVSENWVYIFFIGFLVYTLTMFFVESTFIAWVWLISAILIPVSAYYDIQYTRANSKWNPNTFFWILVLIIPILCLFSCCIYLYRRYEVLGEIF